ncbi:RING-H2 finger protein ATL14 [Hirschfeldia incana]|nr:RING-H2 finger protein ATL14 [Hirschfeldia incana]
MSTSIVHDEPITGDQSGPPKRRHATSLSAKILSKILVCLIMIPVSATALLFILMSLSFSLFFFSLYWFLHRNYRHRRRRESSDGLLSSVRCVKSLPQFKFSESTEYGSECVVCIDGFRRGQWCRKLPGCGHVFHRKCVDFWLVKVGTCPICRDCWGNKSGTRRSGIQRSCFP